MSALNTALEDTFEEGTFEEDTHEELTDEEFTALKDFIKDIFYPEVKDINWEKKVHPDGLVEFFTELDDDQHPFIYEYDKVYTDLIYSFLREHEDKDVLMSFNCTFYKELYPRGCLSFEFKSQNIIGYTDTTRTNTRFVKLGECEVEETVKDLLSELHRKVIDESDYIRYYSSRLRYTSFYIIFKLKEKEEPHIVN